MPVFMMRALVNGKMIGHPVEAEDEESAKAKFEEVLPLLTEQAAEVTRPQSDSERLIEQAGVSKREPIRNEALNGRKFLSIEFQCSACGTALEAEFRDGYLQIAPCPTCLGELESMVAASKRFLDRKK